MYNLLTEMCFQLFIIFFNNNNFYNNFDINTFIVNIQNFVKLMMSIDTKTLNRKEASF
jgi:hypothetical protein